jgi:hypothetical protein
MRRLVTVRVICPALIPDVPLSETKQAGGTVPLLDEGYLLSFITLVGDTSDDEDDRRLAGAIQHWMTGGGKTPTVRRWFLTTKHMEVPGKPTLVRTVTARGRRVLIYRYPKHAGGPNMGHWAAFVQVGDEMVVASVHGRQYVEMAVKMALDLAAQAERSR